MLSQTAEHALRAVLFLARSGGAPVAAEAIADALDAPRNYLSKTLHALAKEGVVTGTRGPGGGFRLTESPDRITLARVIAPFEPGVSSGVCLLGGRPCDARRPCEAHVRWTAVKEAARLPLERTTVAQLLAGDVAGMIPKAEPAHAGL